MTFVNLFLECFIVSPKKKRTRHHIKGKHNWNSLLLKKFRNELHIFIDFEKLVNGLHIFSDFNESPKEKYICLSIHFQLWRRKTVRLRWSDIWFLTLTLDNIFKWTTYFWWFQWKPKRKIHMLIYSFSVMKKKNGWFKMIWFSIFDTYMYAG